MEKNIKETLKIQFEDALDRTGFGLYSYINIFLSGLAITSLSCVVYGSTFTVPASACELQTTGAQRGLMVAAPVIGLIMGAPMWGYLGDTRGRRKMLFLGLLGSALVNALSGFSVNWIMMMLLAFIGSLLAAAAYTLSLTLLSECVPMAKRNMAVMTVNCMTMLAQGIMAVLAIPIAPLTFSYHIPGLNIYWNSWRTLVMVYSLPSVVCACCFYFMQDSPKLTLVKGDEQGALTILRTIHRVNFGKKAVLDVQGLLPESLFPSAGLSRKEQIVPLFRAPLLKYTLIVSCLFMFQLRLQNFLAISTKITLARSLLLPLLDYGDIAFPDLKEELLDKLERLQNVCIRSGSFLAWLPTIANIVMQMYETGEVTNMNLCGIINSDIEIIVNPDAAPCSLNRTSLLIVFGIAAMQCLLNAFVTFVVVNRVGRRNTSMVVTAVLGLCGILVNVVPNTIGTSVLFGAFLLGYIVMGLYTAMAVALFPTHLRAMAIALTVTAGNLTSFTIIQLVNFLIYSHCELGFYLFASIFSSSAIIASFLPDDRFLQKPPQQPRKPSVYIAKL